jgi:hypothetical protein
VRVDRVEGWNEDDRGGWKRSSAGKQHFCDESNGDRVTKRDTWDPERCAASPSLTLAPTLSSTLSPLTDPELDPELEPEPEPEPEV